MVDILPGDDAYAKLCEKLEVANFTLNTLFSESGIKCQN